MLSSIFIKEYFDADIMTWISLKHTNNFREEYPLTSMYVGYMDENSLRNVRAIASFNSDRLKREDFMRLMGYLIHHVNEIIRTGMMKKKEKEKIEKNKFCIRTMLWG